MSLLGIPMAAERQGFLAGSAILAVIGVALLALGPLRRADEAVPGVTPD
jgi:hypothetical protein